MQHFAELSTENQRGAAQLQRWQQSIATFVDLDDRLRQLEEEKASLEAKRAGVARQLEAVRVARLLDEIKALERRSQSHIAERNYDQAVADALKAVELARSLPVPKDPARRPAAQAMAIAQEANALMQAATAYSARGEQRQGITTAQTALQRARSAAELAAAPSDPHAVAIDPRILQMANGLQATAVDLLTVLYALDGNPRAARKLARQRLALAVAGKDVTGRVDALTSVASSHEDESDYLAAVPYLEQAEELLGGLDDRVRLNRIEMNLATVDLNLGDYEGAEPHATKALEAARRLPHRTAPDRNGAADCARAPALVRGKGGNGAGYPRQCHLI